MDHSCQANVEAAARNRVLSSTGLEMAPESAASLKRLAKQLWRGAPSHHLTKKRRQDVVDSYRGRKRARYQRAHNSLLGRDVVRSDARLQPFVKCESNQLPLDKAKDPRMIQARDPRYALELAQYIKPIEGMVYKIRGDGHVFPRTRFIAKGLNQRQRATLLRAKWEAMNDPVAIVLDVSRFDKHVSLEALKVEHYFYRLFFPGDEYFKWLLSLQLHNTAKTRDGTTYSCFGRRASGDMNTALGNCVLMCLMVAHTLSGMTYDMLDDGDDCIVLVERADLEEAKERVVRRYPAAGFKIKIESVATEFEHIDWCRCRPVWINQQWRFVRNPSRVMSTALVTHKTQHMNAQQRKSYFGALAVGLAINHCGVPILGAYSQMLLRSTEGATVDERTESGIVRRAKLELGVDNVAGLLKHVKPNHVSDGARLSFSNAFGIDVATQRAYERHFADRVVDFTATPTRVLEGTDWVTLAQFGDFLPEQDAF